MRADNSVLKEINDAYKELIVKVEEAHAKTGFGFYFDEFELSCPYGVRDKCDKINLMKFNWFIPPERRGPQAIVCNNCLISQSTPKVREEK